MCRKLRRLRGIAALAATLFIAGCRHGYTPPESTATAKYHPAIADVEGNLGTTRAPERAIAHAIEGNAGNKNGAFLTPELAKRLRELIFGSEWQGLDRFPGWTMGAINPTVRVVTRAAKKRAAEKASASNPGASAGASETQKFLDLGSYPLDQQQTVSFDEPSTLPPFTTEGVVTRLGPNTVRGDGPNDLAPEHPESQRLADALNRLAANALDGAKPFVVTLSGASASTPQDLMTALAASGHQVTEVDAPYFANFGHLHYKDQDVMMPFWINTSFAVPGTGWLLGWHARPLLVPVAHAEYEWQVRGQKIQRRRQLLLRCRW